mmetsp:Transcript_91524/g.259146  ORF Transcript_91524/g.259146 Transcript_91524/m.259146 type:complete len:299 (-) Transcript_91524:174-1070(-)
MPFVLSCHLQCGADAPERVASCKLGATDDLEICEPNPTDQSASEEEEAWFPRPPALCADVCRRAPSDRAGLSRGAEELPCWAPTHGSGETSLVPCAWCGSCSPCGCEAGLIAMLEQVALAEESGRKHCEAEEQSTTADFMSSSSLETLDSKRRLSNHVDFSGRWLLSHMEGDMEAIMLDAGVAWSMRKMARAANFGVGLVTQVIEQAGDDLSIEFQNGPMVHQMKLNLGIAEQKTCHEDGTPVVLRPAWDGSVLLLQGKRVADGTPIQPTRRYMAGQDMAVETTSSAGVVVTRFYKAA